MSLTHTLPTLPDPLFHGSAVEFKKIDVSKGPYGKPETEDAKRMLLRVLEADKLGRQLYIASQSVADRLVRRFESVDWRQYA